MNETKHICKLCKERGKTWQGSDPRCAFESGVFNSDNWNCATMNRLREIVKYGDDDFTFYRRDDYMTNSIGIIFCGSGFDAEVEGMTLIMKWYKDRGRTHTAFLLDPEGNFMLLTEELALKIIESVNKMED